MPNYYYDGPEAIFENFSQAVCDLSGPEITAWDELHGNDPLTSKEADGLIGCLHNAGCDPRAAADAILFAWRLFAKYPPNGAAPELYAALEALCEACSRYNLEMLTPEYEQATRSLAKARGEQTPSE